MQYLPFLCLQCSKGNLKPIKIEELECDNCGFCYPIVKEIPRLVELNNYSQSFGFQWNIYQKTQLDSFTLLPISKKRLYAASLWDETTNLDGKLILEAGSGAGRFSEILAETSASIFSFDYSDAVDANKRNNGKYANLNLFQGDIFNIPFKDHTFDHVFCLGVIQHTPDPEAAFHSLVSKLKEGGYIYIDVYTKSLIHLIHWKYILRPITTRIDPQKMHRFIKFICPKLIPISRILRKYMGRFGARLIPIVEYSHLGLGKEINEQWSILDTYDMYTPVHDKPQTKSQIESWFKSAGLKNVKVWYGDNGIVAQGRK